MSYCNGLSVTLNFNPRSPCGERHRIHLATGSTAAFQSTLPVWGATGAGRCRGQGRKISIHAPRVGSDRINVAISILLCHFNPRSPCGERPPQFPCRRRSDLFQSTLPVWGATYAPFFRSSIALSFQSTLPVWGATIRRCDELFIVIISIHAPRVGSDLFLRRALEAYCISIHAPRVGSDKSLRRRQGNCGDFNPRSPCGERPMSKSSRTFLQYFNPRSPCGERPRKQGQRQGAHRFQSTLPVWGATRKQTGQRRELQISIHAPRVGSDPEASRQRAASPAFQSTLPVWGATIQSGEGSSEDFISIHAPRVGSDLTFRMQRRLLLVFQSTLPVWGATRELRSNRRSSMVFQSTLPVWGATQRDKKKGKGKYISIHAPRVGSDNAVSFMLLYEGIFQSTLPVWGATTSTTA